MPQLLGHRGQGLMDPHFHYTHTLDMAEVSLQGQ